MKLTIYLQLVFRFHDMWVPVTTAWRVQVADGGMASDMEGSYESWINSRGPPTRVVLQLGDWATC